jgi:flagellar hook assembly protein FlgD
LPSAFELHQNYPNPFNPTTTIAFTMKLADDVSLDVFNLLGQNVKTLFSGRLSAGKHEFDWDATSNTGAKVASGVYFYRLSSSSTTESKKMILLK